MESITQPMLITRTPPAGRTPEESLTELTRELDAHPANQPARQALYEAMQQMLRKDAFLAYGGETSLVYTVRTPAEFEFTHPKDRAAADIFPHREYVPSRAAMYLLGFALLGLIPAGAGTVLCAPLAFVSAVKLLRMKTPGMDQRRAWVIMLCSLVLWPVGLLLFVILLLHLV